MFLYYTFVVLLASWSASAIPVPDPLVATASGPSPVALTVALCTPFVVLAAVKLSYMKYRRAESIHLEPSVESSSTLPSPSHLVGLGFHPKVLRKSPRKLKLKVFSGYIVGMLGSPEWEAQMKVEVDKAVRKARSQSTIRTPAALSRSTLQSRLDSSHRSHDTSTGGFRSSHRASSRHSSSSRSRTMSVSFLEMYTPNVNISSCSAVHPSSPACADHYPSPRVALESLRSNSGCRRAKRHTSASSLSPILLQAIEPMAASWHTRSSKQDLTHSTDSATRSGSHSPTPPFETPPSTPADMSSTTHDLSRKSTRSDTRNVSIGSSFALSPIIQDTSHLTVPTPVYGRRSSTSNISQSSLKSDNSPLSPTTRPLNISRSLSSPSRYSVEHLSASPSKYPSERDDSSAIKANRQQSGSSPIPLSPLRNHLDVMKECSTANMDESHTDSGVAALGAGSWDLDDLMKNGKLDVDAVTEVLGLGFSLDDPSTSSSNPRSTPDGPNLAESLLRRPGGPLCAIPEESDADDSLMDQDDLRPLSSVIERWGRVQHYQLQKFNVDMGEVRESVSSSILEVDLSLLGIDVSAISGIDVPVLVPSSKAGTTGRACQWTEDDADSEWREEGNSETVGLAC